MSGLVTGWSSSCGHCATPRLTLVGSDTTVAPSALATSTRPAPCSNAVSPPVGLADAVSAAFSCAPVQSGCCWAISAAAPATCGVAIEVPDSDA